MSQDSFIVVYDNQGVFYSPRVCWMFRSMGHEKVAILDGGLPEWVSAGLPTLDSPLTSFQRGNFKAIDLKLFCSADYVEDALHSKQVKVLDARSSGRFQGIESVPRPGLRSGHMPGAINLHYAELLNGNKMKSIDELKKIFQSKIPYSLPLVFSCGSGATACILCLGAELVGFNNLKVYDGSWSEWGLNSDRAVVSEKE